MKTLKLFLSALLITSLFTACEDDSVKAVVKSEVSPNDLQTPATTAFVLTSANKDQNFATITWSAPEYGFAAAVNYTLQADKAGNNFANAVTLASTTALQASLNVGAVNDILLGLGLTPEEATPVEIRVVSNVNSHVATVYSNKITLTLTAFATSFPPIWGMGAALKGWGPWPANAVEWQSTEFRKYETITYFTNDQTFRWFAQEDWGPVSYNYPYFTTVSPVFINGNDGDSNLRVNGPSGWYRVGVDLNAKTVTAVAVDEPVMYITGAGIGGWDQPGTGVSIKMTYLKPGKFQADANFVSGQTFRFFGQANWGPVSYNYPFFTGGVPNFFENANDGDLNFRVVGESGTKKVTVDINEKTVTLGDPPLPVMYMTGAGIGGWDKPGMGASIQMTYKSPGVFEATANFITGEAFRFFAQADWGPTSYNYPYFTTVHPDFVNANDGDSNLRYVGTAGSRKVTINITAKTVALE
ncbi:MAG: SusE domain-containing protein [Cyclobacteriaceae bacterium]|nr:SusE domain-containing protein [Cyclobacteriaceae bacterium]